MDVRRAIRGLLAQAMLFGVLVALHPEPAHADWEQTSGPVGGTIRSFVAVPNGSGGTSLFTGQIRVWSTEDQGASWAHHGNGLTDPNAFALVAVANGSGGNDLLVGTANGIFRSANNGASWSPSGNGVPGNLSIYAMTSGTNGSGGTNLYAGTYLGNAFRSTDNGASWTAANSGLPLGQAHVNAMTTTASGTVLAGTGNGIYRSTNFGASWTRVFNLYGLSFARHGATTYAGTSNGVYRSTDDGATWAPINTGMGFTWTYSMAAIPNGSGVTLFAGAGYVLRSTDNGASWTLVNNGFPSIGVYALATVPNGSGGTDLYAGTSDGVFRSSNNGDSWTNVSFIYSQVRALETTPTGRILASSENDIFRSDNLGDTWTDTQSTTIALDFAVNPHGTQGVSLFAGNSPAGIYKSTDDGVTWTQASNGLDDFDVNSIAAVPNGSGGTHLLAGTYSQSFISTNDGGHWQHANLQTLILDHLATPNGSGGYNIWAGGFGGVWLSTNGGTAWIPRSGEIGGQIVQGLAATANGANLFAGGDPFGVWRSTNNGVNWSPVLDGLDDHRIRELLSPDGTNLFAAGAGGVYLSTDHGESWSSVSTGLTTGVYSLAVSADGSILLAGTTGFGVWKRPIAEMLQVVGVPPGGEAGLALRANRPNPFRTGTTILYSLPQSMPVRLVIFDVRGRVVRNLVDGIQGAGERQAIWDGRDESGSLASPGMYLYRLDAGGVKLTRKMALLK